MSELNFYFALLVLASLYLHADSVRIHLVLLRGLTWAFTLSISLRRLDYVLMEHHGNSWQAWC